MSNAPFLGVELPQNIGEQAAPSSAPETSSDTINLSHKDPSSPEAIQEILDLDKHDKFKWQGKEWSQKGLKDSTLMRDDYTRKTQKHTEEVKQYSKYKSNFHYDLDKVIENPDLLSELKKVYPKEFVTVAERVLSKLQGKSPETQTAPQKANDPRVELLEERISHWEKAQHEAAVEKLSSWVQTQYDSLGKKYEWANQAQITQWSQALLDQGTEISESVLEKLFKSSNEMEKARADKLYSEKAKKQITTGQKSKDTPQGGGVASEAPRKLKTFKEANAAIERDLMNGR